MPRRDAWDGREIGAGFADSERKYYCTVFWGQSLLPMLAPDRKTVYGISYPDAEFFSCDLATGTFKRLGKWLENLSYPGPERSWRGVPRALVVDADGIVWSSGDDGLMRFYDPRIGEFGGTTMRIPGEYWETQNYNAYPVVEQLFAKADGS